MWDVVGHSYINKREYHHIAFSIARRNTCYVLPGGGTSKPPSTPLPFRADDDVSLPDDQISESPTPPAIGSPVKKQ
jgi:hypothetical protein